MSVRSIAALLAAVLSIMCTASAAASMSQADAIRALATSTDGSTLERACQTLRPALSVTVPIRSVPATNANGDEALRAYTRFLTSQRNAQIRIKCMQSLRNISGVFIDPQKGVKSVSPYAADASALVRQILHSDPSVEMRAAAADVLWGSIIPDDGAALLQSAQHDPSPVVRGASFRNMLWPARADIARSHDLASYDTAIAAALLSPDPHIVGGALIARASLHGLAADAAIRPYALDSRPFVRQSAIDAYDYMGAYSPSVACFIESRLSDPDPDVRSSVLLRLFRMGDHAALPAIRRLAQDAPSQEERQEAAQYVRAFANQPDFPHADCSHAAKP